MRTLIIIVIGLLITALTLRFTPSARWLVAGAVFTLIWTGAVLWNLRTGLSHGYTLAQELPIHLLLFAVPMAAYWGYVIYDWYKKG